MEGWLEVIGVVVIVLTGIFLYWMFTWDGYFRDDGHWR